MNPDQRAKLNQYMDENGTKDFTESIRESKRSVHIRADIERMLRFKQANDRTRTDPETFNRRCAEECVFLNSEMNFLYEKLRDDKVDMQVFWKFLAMLERIERGELDQHTASMYVGELLKRMYVDHAIGVKSGVEGKRDISWAEYKKKMD
jgi:hypothetical protein